MRSSFFALSIVTSACLGCNALDVVEPLDAFDGTYFLDVNDNPGQGYPTATGSILRGGEWSATFTVSGGLPRCVEPLDGLFTGGAAERSARALTPFLVGDNGSVFVEFDMDFRPSLLEPISGLAGEDEVVVTISGHEIAEHIYRVNLTRLYVITGHTIQSRGRLTRIAEDTVNLLGLACGDR